MLRAAAGPRRVSVVIPVYNGAPFLDAALGSVFAQTRAPDEVIAVDDGSTDRSPSILAAWAERGVRTVRQANGGPAAARNTGIALATGEYVAFLDQDDGWEPNYLEAILAEFERCPGTALIAAGQRVLTADGARTARTIGKRTAGSHYTPVSLLEGDVGTIVNAVVRRATLLEAGGYDPGIRGPEDCDLWLRISFLAPMRYLAEPLYLYRVHGRNTSRNVLDNARAWIQVLDKLVLAEPVFAKAYSALIRRNYAKQWLRLGRELMCRAAVVPEAILEARSVLRAAVRANPRKSRAWVYLFAAHLPGIAPSYARFRARELAWRERFLVTGAVIDAPRHAADASPPIDDQRVA